MSKLVGQLIQALDNPIVWHTSRWLLNLAFGLYRKRFRLLNHWGILDGQPSVLDIGCGIGQYAALSRGPYLGIDLDPRYIAHARRRYRHSDRAFRAVDVTGLWQESSSFDLVLLVDFLHHLDDEQAVTVLSRAGRLSGGLVASFEPLKQQSNRLGRWIIDHDRGAHIRPLDDLHGLFERAGLAISRSDELYLGPIQTRAILCRKDTTAMADGGQRAA